MQLAATYCKPNSANCGPVRAGGRDSSPPSTRRPVRTNKSRLIALIASALQECPSAILSVYEEYNFKLGGAQETMRRSEAPCGRLATASVPRGEPNIRRRKLCGHHSPYRQSAIQTFTVTTPAPDNISNAFT